MTFDEIMNFGGEANRVAYQKIKKAIQSGNIVPFIGAGLSVDAGYPQWAEALKLFVKYVDPSEQMRMEKTIEIDFEGATDQIEKHIGKRKMHDYLVDMFEEKDGLNTRMYAVGILPYLFPSQLIVTTNFDRVIENAFFITKQIRIKTAIPSEMYKGRRFLGGTDYASLYKVHGDVMSEYSDIVFSTASYNNHYMGTTEVTRSLSALFIAKHLFFLGCSLQSDRTLRLLKTLATEGTTHFAILNEKAKDIAERRKGLSDDYGIDAIFYPTGEYQCVKVILSRLLEELYPDAFSVCVACQIPIASEINRFVYTNMNTDFIGRDEELRKLVLFIEGDERPVTWWALTGAGGSGKSRLVLELSKYVNNHMSGWNTITFKRSERITPQLLTQRVHTAGCNVIVVIDYMQTGLKDIAEWIDNINIGTRCIRILFLQRDGKKKQDIHPSWLSEILSAKGNQKMLLWKSEFLYLETWNDAEIMKELMCSYATHIGKEGKLNDSLDELCGVLQKDEKFMLPLFAMFIADAKLHDNDPCQWDAEQLLNGFCIRERDIYQTQLEGIHGDLGGYLEDYENLVVLATIINNSKLQIKAADAYLPFQKLINAISKKLMVTESQAINKCIQTGILLYCEENNTYNFRCIEPDPFGEFFVLGYLIECFQRNGGRKVIKNLLQYVSNSTDSGIEFFLRAFNDYGEYLRNNWRQFLDFLCSQERWISDVYSCWITQGCFDDFDERYLLFFNDPIIFVNKSAVYHDENNNYVLENTFSMQLSNLADKVSYDKIHIIDKELHRIRTMWPDDSNIVVAMLKCLFRKYTMKYEDEIYAEIVELLKLFENESNIYGVNHYNYKKWLNGLEYTIAKKKCEEMNRLIIRLYKTFPQSENIAVVFAEVLYYRSKEKNSEVFIKTITLIRELTERFPQNETLLQLYAQGVFDLGISFGCKKYEDATVLINNVFKKLPKHEYFEVSYFLWLLNINKQPSIDICIETIGLMSEIFKRIQSKELKPDNIQLLLLLIKKDNEKELMVTMEYLRGITEKFIQKKKMGSFRHGFDNLIWISKITNRTINIDIEILYELDKRFPQSIKIALNYAEGLAVLCNSQDVENQDNTVTKLAKLRERFPKNNVFSEQYAKGLVSLYKNQNAEGRCYTAAILNELRQQFPQSKDIALEYAKVLVEQSAVKNDIDLANTVTLLGKLQEQFSRNQAPFRKDEEEDITLMYTKGLLNLCMKQNAENCTKSVAILGKFAEQYPKDIKIAIVYSQSLAHMSIHQDAKSRISTAARLSVLIQRFPKVRVVIESYLFVLIMIYVNQEDELRVSTGKVLCNFLENYPSNKEITVIVHNTILRVRATEKLNKRTVKLKTLSELIMCLPEELVLNMSHIYLHIF